MKNAIKVVAVATLSVALLLTTAFTTFKNGKVIMIVSIEVKNFSEWKKGFDAGAPIREKAGINVLGICSAVDNENQVVVIEEAANAQVAYEFITLLKSKQKKGSLSKLDIKLYDKAE